MSWEGMTLQKFANEHLLNLYRFDREPKNQDPTWYTLQTIVERGFYKEEEIESFHPARQSIILDNWVDIRKLPIEYIK